MKQAAFAFIAIAALVIHIYGARHDKQYFKKLLFGNSTNHVVYLDYLRVLATVFVIASHSLAEAISSFTGGTGTLHAMQIVEAITLCCDNLFFMISGALILSGGNDDESIYEFYKKRFLKVLVPCFAYYCFYEMFAYGTTLFKPAGWHDLFVKFLANWSPFTPHFWMIFVILILYIEAPILRVGLKHMSERMLSGFVVTIFIVHAIYTYLPTFGFEFAYTPFVASYTAVFILGYYLTTNAAMRHYKTIMLCALASLVFSIVLIFTRGDYSTYIYNNAPPAMFMASAIFLFFRKHSEDYFSKGCKVLDMLCKYSYSILMIHWYVLFILIAPKGLTGLSFGIVGGVTAATILTVIIGLLFAIVYDNTVVLVMRKIIDAVIELVERIVHKLTSKKEELS